MFLTYQSQLRTESDAETIANLIRKGWLETVPPSFNPDTQHAPEWINGDWTIRDLTPEEIAARNRKVWPNAQSFLTEFTFPEMAQIGLSSDPTIAALRLLLSAWAGEVYSDDARVQTGLDALASLGIVSSERRAEILA